MEESNPQGPDDAQPDPTQSRAEEPVAEPKPVPAELGSLSEAGRELLAVSQEVFKDFLGEQLERMHGAREHRGRVPGIGETEVLLMQRITDLKGELEHAIREEAYEEAATLRDQLKNLETEHEAPSGPL